MIDTIRMNDSTYDARSECVRSTSVVQTSSACKRNVAFGRQFRHGLAQRRQPAQFTLYSETKINIKCGLFDDEREENTYEARVFVRC